MCPFTTGLSKTIEEAELLVVHYHSRTKEFRLNRCGTEREINFATIGAAKMGDTAHNVTCNIKP